LCFFLQENIDWLTEKIQNLEDKLSAADNVKELLQEELHTYREHNQKMSRDLEVITKNIQEKLDLQLPVQSVPITNEVVSSNPACDEVYSIQHYVIKFVSDLRQVRGFLRHSGFLHQ